MSFMKRTTLCEKKSTLVKQESLNLSKSNTIVATLPIFINGDYKKTGR